MIGEIPFWVNQTWFRVAEGYIWSGFVQPVKNEPFVNPSIEIPETGTQLGKGYWAEICVPYLDLDPGLDLFALLLLWSLENYVCIIAKLYG